MSCPTMNEGKIIPIKTSDWLAKNDLDLPFESRRLKKKKLRDIFA